MNGMINGPNFARVNLDSSQLWLSEIVATMLAIGWGLWNIRIAAAFCEVVQNGGDGDERLSAGELKGESRNFMENSPV
jgi:hypothetical protein